MKKIKCFIILIIIISGVNSVYSRTIWRDRNIYSSGGDLNVGDIVVVNVDDISQLKFNITFNNDNSYNIISNPDKNITNFLPKISSDKKITASEKTDYSEKGNLQISIASRITSVTQDGKLNITGAKEYSINGKINRFFLSGIADPDLIKGRTLLSGDISNFRLEIRGLQEPGAVNIQRAEPGTDGTASGSLTETEKQQIIVDYLNKMLRELNR
ncbi:MAG: flagellar basal body L-ring protein FlgH [Spirochaetes bacterium]|nr:flagellar basal body L-ring protein FlgH [Spirochaetota bacterium]